jgi:hypothetical protein
MMAAQLPKPPELRFFPLHDILEGPACTCNQGASCERIGKHPAVRWRTYDENTKAEGGGHGIQTGHFNGIFVIDLDVKPAKDGKPPKDGVTALLQLAAGRPIPDTLSVLTPSGGVHLYFRLPPDVYVPTTHSILAPGIDIQGEGSFVVGPGSPHKIGGIYKEEPGVLADPPDWLLALVVKQAKPRQPLTTERYTVDPESPRGIRAIAWAKEYLLKAEPAVQGQGGSNRFFAVCCHLMISALPLDVLKHLIEEFYNPLCQPEWSEEEIDHKLADADRTEEKPRGLCSPDFLDRMYSRTKNTAARQPDPLHEYTFEIGMRSTGETHKASFGEICADLFDHKDWAGVLRYDTFRDLVVAVDPPMKMDAETTALSDNDVRLVRAWFEYHGKKPNPSDVQGAIETVARRHAFHSVQEMLRSLEWDGILRLDRVLPEYFQSPDGLYERAIGPRWFISLVARAMQPGCQSDCTLILEQRQHGVGKTSAFRALMREPYWYAESSCGVDSKDFLENLRGIWLVGFDELDSLTRGSLTKVKTVLTQLHDHYRKSFGHNAGDYPRACGFCGTTNAEQYLNDMTGGRRFWPVRVLRAIDVKKIARDRDQLWAEAYARWEAGEAWHVDSPELRTLCEAEQEDRLEADGWEEIIRRWFNDPAKFSHKPVVIEPGSVFKGVQPFDGSGGVTTADVLEHAIGKLKGQWTRGDSMRVGGILRHLKMECVQIRLKNGDRERRYVIALEGNKTD